MTQGHGLFDREGHLSELGLHHVVAEELEGEAAARVEAHLGSCAGCAARLEALRAEAASPLPPLRLNAAPEAANSPPPDERPRTREDRWAPWFAVASALVAAAVALVVLPTPSEDEFRARSASLSLEVWREAAGGAERLQDGDAVRPGDRLGFRVSSSDPGFLLVLGRDGAGTVYPVWPPQPEEAADFAAAPQGAQLEVSLVLDATPGEERLVAFRCPRQPLRDEVENRLREAAAAPGQDLAEIYSRCAQSEVRLVKAP